MEQAKDRVGKPKDDMDSANGFDEDGDKEELDESDEGEGDEAIDQDDEASDEDSSVNTAITSSPDDPNEMAVLKVLAIWRQYRPRLLNDFSRVGYLVSPHPKIIEHASNPDNVDLEDREAVERLIKKLVLPKFHVRREDAERELAELVHIFWTEQALFHNNQGYFAKPGIWFIANDEKTLAHEWHKNYSRPVTKVFGKLACYVCALPLGIGQAERSWKAIKRNKSGKRSRLSSDKTKKQSVVCAAYSHEKSEARRVQAQKAGQLWSDEDFAWCKIDSYCTGSIIEQINTGPVRAFRFRAWEEHWEKNQFNKRGDSRHAAGVSAKWRAQVL